MSDEARPRGEAVKEASQRGLMTWFTFPSSHQVTDNSLTRTWNLVAKLQTSTRLPISFGLHPGAPPTTMASRNCFSSTNPYLPNKLNCEHLFDLNKVSSEYITKGT